LLLHRYHNIDYILQLDVDTAIELIAKAQEKEREERIFQQWVAQLPVMAYSGQSVSFADYKDRVTGANIDRRSAAEIMRDLDEVEKELQRGGDENGA
jgi:hypothetical protein